MDDKANLSDEMSRKFKDVND